FTVELWSIKALRFEKERPVRSASPAGSARPCDDRAKRALFQLEGPSMNRILGATLVFVLGLPVAAGHKGGGKPATPAEQYRALLKEYQDVPEDLAKAKTAEERKKVVTRLRTLPLRFLELAEKHPKDPVALEALIQTVAAANSTIFPAGGKDSPGQRALTILLRDHVKSDKLGPVCQQIVFGFH